MRRGIACVIVTALATGCLTPSFVPCGDLECPQGAMCVAESVCATPDSLAACSGVADGTTCHDDNGDGNCMTGVCVVSVCGDGVVSGLEQCDGSAVPVGCTDLGYYGGDVTCNKFCAIDRSDCAGKCGDGIVQLDQGELCDGAPPAGYCTDFGEDMGSLSCNAACGADINDCGRFGWTAEPRITSYPSASAGGHGWFGVVYASGSASLLHDGISSSAPATYSAIAISATTAWAAGSANVSHWTVADGWVDEPAPWPAGSTVHSMWASDTLGVWVALTTSPLLWTRDAAGTWSTVSGRWAMPVTFGVTHSIVVALSATAPQAFDGTTWSTFAAPAQTTNVVEDDRGTMWAAVLTVESGQPGPGELQQRDSTGTWQLVDLDAVVSQIAPAEHGVFVDGIQNNHAEHTNTEYVWSIGSVPFMELWPDDVSGTLVSDGFAPYAMSPTGTQAMTRGQLSDLGQVYGGSLLHIAGGPLTIGPTWSTLTTSGTFAALTLPAATCDYAVVNAAGKVYCYDGTQLWDGSRKTALTSSSVLWVAGDDSAAVAGGTDVLAERKTTAGAYVVTAPRITFTEIAGDTIDDLYAIATADGGSAQLWHRDAMGWQAVTTGETSPQHLVVGATRVFLTDSLGIMVYGRATAQLSHMPYPASAYFLTHGVGDELFLGSGFELWRYDGARWAPVRTPSTVSISRIFGFDDQLMIVTASPISPETELTLLGRTDAW